MPGVLVHLVTGGHGYATIFTRGDAGWGAMGTSSTTSRLASVGLSDPLARTVSLDALGQGSVMGAGLHELEDYTVVLLIYGDVDSWSYSMNDVSSYTEVARGTGVRAYTVADLEEGIGAGVETLGPGLDVAVGGRLTREILETGFGYFGTLDLVESQGGANTMELTVTGPTGDESCPCIFLGDEERLDVSVLDYVPLEAATYSFAASGLRVQSLTTKPLLVLADIPDPTPDAE